MGKRLAELRGKEKRIKGTDLKTSLIAGQRGKGRRKGAKKDHADRSHNE